MNTKFRKKPVEIEARQLTFDSLHEIIEWLPTNSVEEYEWGAERTYIVIGTLEGLMTATEGDWIIKGVKGEFYPCKPDIFEITYEPVYD
jgi:hypothetical protein